LSVASDGEQVPIDMELYLPESRTSDVARRRRVRIPDSVVFKTKVELAVDMIARAVDDGVPGEVVLADSFMGAHTSSATSCVARAWTMPWPSMPTRTSGVSMRTDGIPKPSMCGNWAGG
jgi:SRSO17 transposase